MRSAANVSQTLRRTEWQTLMKRLPRTLAEYIVKKSLPPPGAWAPARCEGKLVTRTTDA
jgi:hypothetical protein